MENFIFYLLAFAFIVVIIKIFTYYQTKVTIGENTPSLKINSLINDFFKIDYSVIIALTIILGALLAVNTLNIPSLSIFSPFSLLTGIITGGAITYLTSQLNQKQNYKTITNAQISPIETSKMILGQSSFNSIFALSFTALLIGTSYLAYQTFFGTEWKIEKVVNTLTPFMLGLLIYGFYVKAKATLYEKSAQWGSMIAKYNDTPIDEKITFHSNKLIRITGSSINNCMGFSSQIAINASIAIISAMVLGAGFASSSNFQNEFIFGSVLLPLAVFISGLLVSLLQTYLMKYKENGTYTNSAQTNMLIAIPVMILMIYYLVKSFLPLNWDITKIVGKETITYTYTYLGVFWSIIVGLLGGLGFSLFNEYFTGKHSPFTKAVSTNKEIGTNQAAISGIENGIYAAFAGLLILATIVASSYHLAGFYGIALAAVGMLSLSGFTGTVNNYFDVVKSVQKEAEINQVSTESIQNIENLKSANLLYNQAGSFLIINTTIVSIALFSTFLYLSGMGEAGIDIAKPSILICIATGIFLPVLFTALLSGSILKGAKNMADEIQRQFNDIPVLKSGIEILKKYNFDTFFATYDEKAVLIQAESATEHEVCNTRMAKTISKEISIAFSFAVLISAIAGIFAGIELLGSILAGSIISTFVLVTYKTSNANLIENATISGQSTSETENSVSITFRDTISPVLMLILELMLVTAVLIAPRLIEIF